MAEPQSPKLRRRDRFFPAFLVSGLAVILAIVSFSEQDRRGLLSWDRPSAFVAGDAMQGPDSYEIAYLGYARSSPQSNGLLRRASAVGDPVTGARDPITGARRSIPARGEAFGPAAAGAPPSQLTSPLALGGPAGSGGNSLIAPTAGNGNSGLTPFTPGNLGGIGATPPGVIAPIATGNPPPATGGETPPGTGGETPPAAGGETPPVVPAVPEPAAWLLMILGVGVLASALRSNARRTLAVLAKG